MPKQTYPDEAGMYNVRLGWTPGNAGHVQIGVETTDGRPIVQLLKNEAADHLVDGNGDDPAPFRSLWGTLDRASINALIRDLRRARDSVYGADA